MEVEKSQVWVCEASRIETQHELNHQRGNFLLVYQLSLCSVKPLQENQVLEALTLLRRKCQTLRLSFGQRNGSLWLRQCTNERIDFQVVTTGGAGEVFDELQSYRYNSETGPMWCARLLTDTTDNKYNIDKEDCPYTSQFFLGIHHGITDGISNLKICGWFISILNDVIAGTSIDEKQQLGQFVSDRETDKLVASKMEEMQKSPQLKEEFEKTMTERGLGMPMLLEVFPPPDGEDKTCNVTHVLDEEITQKFINKSKAEGVSFHSAYTALGMAAIVKVLSENGYIKDFYNMCHGNVINLRRYWSSDTSHVLGCHAYPPLDLWIQVPRIMHNFWDFTRNIHKDIHYHLKSETILLREAYLNLCSEGERSFDDNFRSSDPVQRDFCTSNLGDVTALLTEGGPYVRPFLLTRHISLHKIAMKNFRHVFQTLRGRLILNLLYNTKYATKDLAEYYCQTIFSLLEEVL